jgi:DNA-binding NtrC family response regulator
VESYSTYDGIYSELNDNKYSGVVLTDNSLQPPMVAELLPELKMHYPAMPIYVLSVYTEHGLGEYYIKLGATDVFPIPVNVEELVKRLT